MQARTVALTLVVISAAAQCVALLSIALDTSWLPTLGDRIPAVTPGAAGALLALTVGAALPVGARRQDAVPVVLCAVAAATIALLASIGAVMSAALVMLAVALASRAVLARWHPGAEALLLTGGVLGYLALAAYAHGVAAVHAGESFISPQASLSLIAICGILLVQKPSPAVDRWSRRPSIGGVMVRNMLPVALAAPLVVGWITRVLVSERMVAPNLAPLLLAETLVVVFGAAAVIYSRWLDQVERRSVEELASARDAALDVSRLKSAFLANMSHEIRTPLNGIIGMTDMLASSSLEPSQREQVELIVESGRALRLLVDDVLDISRIEADRVELEQVSFDLRHELELLVQLVAGTAQEKGLALELRVADDVLAQLVGDVSRIRQVLTNLLGNAVKFTAAGGVTVTASVVARARDGQLRVRLEVADTGIGIEPERLEEVFEPFTQADASTTRRFGGTGLGLAISRSLAELMGGTLCAESTPGEGSTFEVTLPLEQPAASPGGASAPSDGRDVEARRGAAPLAAGARPWAEPDTLPALVVEDNPVNQRVIGSMLDRLAVPFRLAQTGSDALQLHGRERFSLVLMDCQMPELDGYAATREIRRREAAEATPQPRLPVIAMTAHAMPGDREQCLAAGMDDYLAKPIDADRLEDALRRWWPAASGTGDGADGADGGQGEADEDWDDFVAELWHETADLQLQRARDIAAAARHILDGTVAAEHVRVARAAAHDLAGTLAPLGEPAAGDMARALSPHLRRAHELSPAERGEVHELASAIGSAIEAAIARARRGGPARS